MKPVLFVTGHAPADRVGAFARLHELEDVEFALFGGRSKHGVEAAAEPANTDPAPGDPAPGEPAAWGHTPADMRELPFPHRYVRQRELAQLCASGRYRAVVCGTGGRVALPASWAGARRAQVPLILWASLWAHPRSAAHALSFPALRRLYRSADAVVTYGEHVSEYVRARGARNVFVAPQAVDNDFWGSSEVSAPHTEAWPGAAAVKFLFVGRAAREKGLGVLAKAWSSSGLAAPSAALVLVGVGSDPPWIPAGGAVSDMAGSAVRDAAGRAVSSAVSDAERDTGGSAVRDAAGGAVSSAVSDANPAANIVALEPVARRELRNFYGAAHVLVLPSIQTRTFREPWGLVVNEAMNQRLPVIVSDAVGAAAGGLVRDGHNGLVVAANDSEALAGALVRLAHDESLRRRLGAAGARDVRAYTYDAWAQGFSSALSSVGAGRAHW